MAERSAQQGVQSAPSAHLEMFARIKYSKLYAFYKEILQKENDMIDFSKKRKKGTRIIATIICVLIVLGMIIGLLVTTFQLIISFKQRKKRNNDEMYKRSLFYWAKLYYSQLKKGQKYKELCPVITINILDFNLFKDTRCNRNFILKDENGITFSLPSMDTNSTSFSI